MSSLSSEIQDKIKKLKERAFYINMNDHLSSDDYDALRKISEEIRELEKQLEELNE